MKLNERVSRFIEEHITDIDNNDFITCYNDLWLNVSSHEFLPSDIGQFTTAMDEADINVLDYLTKIPECCYYNTDYTGHYLPGWVTEISGLAFTESAIEEIDCGRSMQKICNLAFKDCMNLDTIIIHPHPSLVIDSMAFKGCNNLICIIFKGTKEQWLKVLKHDGWKNSSAINTVRCTDGDIWVGN